MGLGLARCAYDAVERKIRFCELHPDVLIQHHVTPTWHWSARLPGGRELVNSDLSLLLDQLSALTHPAPHGTAQHPQQAG